MTDQVRIAGYVLTRNEAANVARAVDSLSTVCDDIVVVDSGSTDGTAAIAETHGADVVVHPFGGFSAQRNFAIDHVQRTYSPDYILCLDADEWMDDALVADLRERIAASTLTDDVYLLHLQIRFDGRALRWGGFANTWLPRLFRTGAARYEDRVVNEHLSLADDASIGRLRGRLVNDDVVSWEDHIAKHNRYSTLEARARIALRAGEAERTTLGAALRRPYLRRRWLRQHVWDRLPARPAIRLVQIYILAGGFLDGRAGFRRALFEAWQEMCTDLKAEQLMRGQDERPASPELPGRGAASRS